MGEQILIYFVTFLSGVIITRILDKFKNRISFLKYTVWHQHLGASVDDSRFGSVKLLYNEKPIKNLYMSTILLSNESNRDLSNIEINIACNPDSAILISYGRNKASANELSFTDRYTSILLAQKPEDTPFIFGRRDYKLPVLNRGDKVDFSLLTTSLKEKQPVITVNCDHPGVKMKYAVVFNKLFGESQIHSALLGTLIAVLICILIICFLNNRFIAILLAFLIGLFASLLGVFLLKIYKFIYKILS